MAIDAVVFFAAFLPLAGRTHQLGILASCLDVHCLRTIEWWCCTTAISTLYWLHGFIWNYPDRFAAACRRAPLRALGDHPVQVFARLEILGKFWQLGALALYAGQAGRASALLAVQSAAPWCWAAAAAYLLLGQGLNLALYAAIGNDGVYYGFKLGRNVPWCSGFPFNVGLRHPQYVGVVLTILAGTILLLCAELAEQGVVQACLAWAAMYVAMSAMEELGDNDKNKE